MSVKKVSQEEAFRWGRLSLPPAPVVTGGAEAGTYCDISRNGEAQAAQKAPK